MSPNGDQASDGARARALERAAPVVKRAERRSTAPPAASSPGVHAAVCIRESRFYGRIALLSGGSPGSIIKTFSRMQTATPGGALRGLRT